MSSLSNYNNFSAFAPYGGSGGSRGIGFNRGTWNAGKAIGKNVKELWNKYKSRREAGNKKYKSKSRKNKSTQTSLPQRGSQVALSGGDSCSRFSIINKKNKVNKIVDKRLQRCSTVENSAVRATSLEGKQSAFMLMTLFDAADLLSLFANTGSNSVSSKLSMETAYGTGLITNAENSNSRFVIYDVMARRDSNNAGYKTPLLSFTNGFADAAGGSAVDYLVPGASPFSNTRFTEYYKILQQTDIILAPGATHKHVMDYRPHRMFSHEVISALGSGSLQDFTIYSFIVFMGTPVDTTIDHTIVTLSPSNLNVVTSVEYRVTELYLNFANNIIINSLTLAGAVETMSAEGIVQAETSA